MGSKSYKRKILGLLLIVLLLSVTYLFLIPIIKYRAIVLSVGGSQTSPKIDYINIEILNRPTIDLFSRSNPQGDLKFKILLINEKSVRLLDIELLSIGQGKSIFELRGELKGNIQIESMLTTSDGRPLDAKKASVVIG